MDVNVYYHPEQSGLETVGEIEFSDENYQFDLLVVWQRKEDGAFFYGTDSGCSCPTPFEGVRSVEELIRLTSISHLQDAVKRHTPEWKSYSDSDIARHARDMVDLEERLHARGLR